MVNNMWVFFQKYKSRMAAVCILAAIGSVVASANGVFSGLIAVFCVAMLFLSVKKLAVTIVGFLFNAGKAERKKQDQRLKLEIASRSYLSEVADQNEEKTIFTQAIMDCNKELNNIYKCEENLLSKFKKQHKKNKLSEKMMDDAYLAAGLCFPTKEDCAAEPQQEVTIDRINFRLYTYPSIIINNNTDPSRLKEVERQRSEHHAVTRQLVQQYFKQESAKINARNLPQAKRTNRNFSCGTF